MRHRIFRAEKEAVWEKLARELGGNYLPGAGHRGATVVQVRHDPWLIQLDTYKKGRRPVVTRLRAPYVNRDSFEFRIFRRNLASGAKKLLGMQDVGVGHEAFDKDFIIQTNDPVKVKRLFDHDRIRQLISWQPAIDLLNEVEDTWAREPFSQGISELSFQTRGVISDLQQLRDLYELFAEILNHLCHLGSAYEDDPFLV